MKRIRNASRRDVVLYVLSANIPAITALGAGLIVRRELGPADFGVYFLLLAVGQYLAVLHSPLNSVVDIEVPILQRDDPSQALRLIRSASRWLLVIGAAEGLVLFAGTVILLPRTDANLLVAGAVAIALPLDAVAQQQRLVLKVRGEFAALASRSTVGAVAEAAVDVVLTVAFGIPGFVVAVVGGAAIRAALFRTAKLIADESSNESPGREPVGHHVRKVLGSVTFYKLSQTLTETVDRVVAAAVLGTEQLGVYSLAVAVVSVVRLVPRAVSGALLPGLLRTDESDLDAALSEAHALVCLVSVTIGSIAICGIEAVPFMLPAYEDAILPARILIVAEIIQQSRFALANRILTATDRRPLALSSGVGMVAAAALAFVAAQRYETLSALATASVVAYLLAFVLLTSSVPARARNTSIRVTIGAAGAAATVSLLASKTTTFPIAVVVTVIIGGVATARIIDRRHNTEVFRE